MDEAEIPKSGQAHTAAAMDPEAHTAAHTAAYTEAHTEAETAQERLGKLATAVVKELRKGIDVGSVAAARAQAIRR